MSDDNECSDDNACSDYSESETHEEEEEEDEIIRDMNGNCRYKFRAKTTVNSIEDFGKVNLNDLTSEDITSIHFPNVDVAFTFYNWYGSVHGFSARKSKILWNSKGEMIQQTFLCHKEGYRAEKNMNRDNRRRQPKDLTRCGCMARYKVHIEESSGHLYIKYFNDVHNHTFIANKYSTMLPAHRKISDYDKY